MELKDIVSVSGVPGLHKIIGKNKVGLIVESLTDQKKFATNARQRVSVLADIAVFTEDGEARLWQVLKSIKALEDGGKTIPGSKAENEEVRAFMAEVLPAYDTEKVYVSDMKKLFSWYQMVKPVLDFEKLGEEETEENAEGTEKTEGTALKKSSDKIIPKNTKTSAPKTAAGAKVKTTTPRKMGS
ncbi:MAG: DUF5606 domain-containing protein [Bacteroidetes bacterium]|nr:DUF5606 domain-containing protein [Bacteroidota bacterium]